MNFSKLSTSLLLLLIPLAASSQSDSTYITKFDKNLSIKIYTQNKFVSLFRRQTGKDFTTFMSNKPVDIGLGFTWKDISLSGSYGFSFLADPKLGKTKSFDFQYHRYARNYVWDVYFLQYKGFYTGDDDTFVTLYPDLKICQYGSYAQYVFNNKKFSYRATFGQRERQLKSAGSLLLGGGMFYNTLQANANTIRDESINLCSFHVGVNAGYAYTWVATRRLFVSGSLSGAINVGNSNNDKSLRQIKFYPGFLARLSVGYNADNWSIGASYINNSMSVLNTQNSNLTINTGNAEVAFIKRFDASTIFRGNTAKMEKLHNKITNIISLR